MPNLIKNGEFNQGEMNWKVLNRDQVRFHSGECNISPLGSISQDIGNIEAGTEYALSARMKSTPGLKAQVILMLQPNGKEMCLSLADADNWQVLTDWIMAPPGTTWATVTLVTEGKTTTAWAHFGSLELLPLDQNPPTTWPPRILAWVRSWFRA